jgi:IS30 family transposase
MKTKTPAIDKLERTPVEYVFSQHNSNGPIAGALGVHRAAIIRKMKEYHDS